MTGRRRPLDGGGFTLPPVAATSIQVAAGGGRKQLKGCVMSELKFTEDHEWLRMDNDDIGVVGITDYAQDQLGELVFVDLPQIDAEFEQGAEVAVVESVKAAGEVKAPVGGTIVEVNASLPDSPEAVNSDPTGDGWFFKLRITDPAELDELMSEEDYQAFIAEL